MKVPRYIPQLDVLRGLAILYVMFYHAAKNVPALHLLPVFRFGFTGVDLFFVLSGFLITGILVRTKDADCYFTNFYMRRILRIWPLYYALLLFAFVLLPTVQPHLKAEIFGRSHPWQSFPFFLQNFFLRGEAFGMLTVTWSLAIEEQFYLVWPLIVRFAPRRILMPLALLAPCVSILLRGLAAHGLLHVNMTTNPFTRLDGLALGSFLALWIPEAENLRVKRTGIVLVIASLPVLILLGWFDPDSAIFYTLVSIFFAGLLCISINAPRIANLKFMKYTGKISYGLYLLHVPSFDLLREPGLRKLYNLASPVWSDILLLFLSIALSYMLAIASWYFFETQFLRLKSNFQFDSRTSRLGPIPEAPSN